MPALAQEPKAVGPEVRQQIEELVNKHADAVNKNQERPGRCRRSLHSGRRRSGHGSRTVAWFSGPQAIEKRFAVELTSGPGLAYIDKLVQVCQVGDEISAISQWSCGTGAGCYARIFTRDADTWKIRVEYASLWHKPQ